MKTIKLTCATCGDVFDKRLNEYNRQIKSGKIRFFCNLSCACSKRNLENPTAGKIENLRPSRKDEFTPFRWFILRAQYRDKQKKQTCNITVEYLKTLWESQKGICPLTGWNLMLPAGTLKAWDEKHPANASLDRIDNSKGYIEGNVRFISFMANIGRSTFSDEQLIEFCKAVVKNK